MTKTDSASHTHNLTETDAALAAVDEAMSGLATRVGSLEARVAKLEAAPPPVDPPPVDPPPTTPPPTGKVVQFPSTGSSMQLLTLMRDLSVDVIDLQAGTYPRWAFIDGSSTDKLGIPRPADRSLLIRPRGDVVWDGTGLPDDNPAFRIGWLALFSNIKFDPSGMGTFTAQNYRLGKSGLVQVRYSDNVTFNGLRVRNVTGGFGAGSPQIQHTHCLYRSTDGTHRSGPFTANDWDVVGPANRWLNGLQTDGSPNGDGVTAKGWKVRNLNRAVYAWANPTGLVIDGWDIADCNVTIDNNKGGTGAAGVVSNCKAVNSGPLAVGQGWWGGTRLVSGGGNTAT